MADGKRRTAVATPPGMALVRAGTFAMGENLDGESDAIPTNICVSQFYMDINLVSLSQWQSVYFLRRITTRFVDRGECHRPEIQPVADE